LRVARAAGIAFQSVANQTRFIMARNALRAAEENAGNAPSERRQALRDDLHRILRDEIALAQELFQLARDDSRIGFEASNHYFFTPNDLVEKVVHCEWALEALEAR
ncbi:MAG TPA: hypothetical protein VK116_02395, partial [Planctomycetota bacterium]|nr:hypothetical protein [Planctomycetota bacterium]